MDSPKESGQRKLVAEIRPRKLIVLILDDGRTITIVSRKHRGRMRLCVPEGQGVTAIRRPGK